MNRPLSTLLDSNEIARTLELLVEPGQVVEVRTLSATTYASPRYPYQASGYFDDRKVLVLALTDLKSARGFYITLQPCQRELLARAHNRLRSAEEMRADKSSTSDQHILRYRWLLLDCDPDRPAGISSSDEEHTLALQHAEHIKTTLSQRGWPLPITADSGNGAHLLYRIDLPVDESGLVKRALEGLAGEFDLSTIHLDQKVFNPSRISKLYGTLACKGDNTPDRPHRMSRLLSVPDQLICVSREQLEAVATPKQQQGSLLQQMRQTSASFNLDGWIVKHGLDLIGPSPWKDGGRRWVFPVCPWNSEHTDKSAYIVQHDNGAIAAGCQHNSCRGKGWHDLRALYEPETRDPTGLRARKGFLLAKETEEIDTTPIDQALAHKNLEALLEAIPLLALLPKTRYLKYKHQIKEQFGKALSLTDLDSAVHEERKAALGEEEKESQANALVTLAEQEATLFATAGGICYARVPVRDHYETYPIHEKGSGSLFKLWLLHRYQQEWHSLPSETALNTALMTLVASALFNQQERQEVFTRIGYKDGRIYLDLADLDHYVVEIDRNGWRLLQQAPVCFRRSNGIGALPIPKRGGSLALLDRFLNMDANGLLLAKAWAIAGLHPTGPYPVLGLHGEQGAAKTTTARVLRSLIDPCVAFLRPSPKDIQALTIAAANNHIIGLDNLSTLPEWLSDALCRTATGAGDAYRQLYTDRDEVVFSYTKPILFTGIEEVGTRSDLLDRCIIIHLPILPPQCRKTEKDFWEEFGEAHPYILGAILDAVSLALRTYESIDLPEKPRMADFAVWITACQDALFPASASKRSFMDVYMYNRSQAVEIAIEASPVGTAIKKLMHTKDIWTGNAETLLTQIAQVVSEDTRRARSWPRNGRALSSRLKRLATSLRETGLDVIWGRDNKERSITLKKEKQASGGDANEGLVTQNDAKNFVCVTASTGLSSDGKASGDASDANFLFLVNSKNEKEEREENFKKENKERMGKFASLASPHPLNGLDKLDEAVTQTQKLASPLRHRDSFASPGIDLSLSLNDDGTAENANS